MKIFIILILLIPAIAFSQTKQADVISGGGAASANATYSNFGTFGQPFAGESTNASYKNADGFINGQNMLADTAYVSDTFTTSTSQWGYDHFNNVNVLMQDCSVGAKVHLSNYHHTGNVDMTGFTFIIDSQDFTLNGSLTGGLIRAINTGYLIQTASQNTACTFPVTDGTNDLSVSITSLNAPVNPIKVKVNTSISGTYFIASSFLDIIGDSNLNATMVFNISKTALSDYPGTIRFWNGSRYVPIPSDRTLIEDMGTYYKITITGINQF